MTMSSHLSLEIAAAVHRGSPLAGQEPVPGCNCSRCTGLPRDGDEILGALLRTVRSTTQWAKLVKQARAVSILDVVTRLGSEPIKRGNKLLARCPLHDDRNPSMALDEVGGLWYCFVCGEGGDGIRLWQRARCTDFTTTVKELSK